MPHDRDALRVLVERVRAATGELPDDVLGRLLCALEGKAFGWVDRGCGDDGSEELRVASRDDHWFFSEYRHRCPDVSLDAALALMERALPVSKPGYQLGDYTWEIIRRYDGSCRVVLLRSGGVGMWGRIEAADGATAPLAVILALLTALLAQAEAEAGGQP